MHILIEIRRSMSRRNLIARIDDGMEKITERISPGQSSSISYVGRRNTTAELDSQEQAVYPVSSTSTQNMKYFDQSSINFTEKKRRNTGKKCGKKTVTFMTRRRKDKLALMTMIMAQARNLLLTNRTRTRRSFYYYLKNHTSLVTNQKRIDSTVNDVSNVLECAPWDLSKTIEYYLITQDIVKID